MKIGGRVQIATTPESTDLSKQAINYAEDYLEVDSSNVHKSQYSLVLAKNGTAIEIIPSQITRARLIHIRARFPDDATVRTIGVKLKEGSGGTIDVDYKSCKEFFIYGECDIFSCLVENDEDNGSGEDCELDIIVIGSDS